MNPYVKWLTEQWTAMGVFFDVVRAGKPPLLLVLLLVGLWSVIFFAPQPGPAFALLFWLGLVLLAILTHGNTPTIPVVPEPEPPADQE